ncbi:hypothetical protein XENOCAPTIV_011987, partial [Xenoophorus captivus]
VSSGSCCYQWYVIKCKTSGMQSTTEGDLGEGMFLSILRAFTATDWHCQSADVHNRCECQLSTALKWEYLQLRFFHFWISWQLVSEFFKCTLFKELFVSSHRDVCVQEALTIQPTYSDLLSRMRNVFKVDDIALNYRDPEGDLIRLLDNEDVQLMIREGRRQQDRVKRPVNQFPWELHVTMASDLSVYGYEP